LQDVDDAFAGLIGHNGAGLRRVTAAVAPTGSRLSRISSWFVGDAAPRSVPSSVRHDPDIATARREAARDVFLRIGGFLDTHDLAPTVDHFHIARCYILGEDIALTQAIDRQLRDHGRLDAAFMAQATVRNVLGPLHPDRITEMADRLAARLAESETTVHQSHVAACDYETALTAQAATAEDDPDGTIQRLLSITMGAIARTQQLADRLRQTRSETTRLRQHLEKARRAADEDHLTGLPNRRCYDGRLAALAATCDGRTIHSVALCDIDDFKAINDRHGHATGDRVLKLVARHMTKHLGERVLVARHGGEEFACLFENCRPHAAFDALDAMRASLGTRALVNERSGEGIGCLSFSAGVAALGNDPSAAMRTADAALYTAKREGKNRIILA